LIKAQNNHPCYLQLILQVLDLRKVSGFLLLIGHLEESCDFACYVAFDFLNPASSDCLLSFNSYEESYSLVFGWNYFIAIWDLGNLFFLRLSKTP
jgi:hypothetical protein